MNLLGLSYSRCLLDIFAGTVNYDDVICIISRTRFDPEDREMWENSMWPIYKNSVWSNYNDEKSKEELYKLTTLINKDGKLHQPRLFTDSGNGASMTAWLKCDIVTYEEIIKHNKTKYSEEKLNSPKNLTEEDFQIILGAMI